jgi:hypothetical protein
MRGIFDKLLFVRDSNILFIAGLHLKFLIIYLSSYYDGINAKLMCDNDYSPCGCFQMSGQIQCIGDEVNEDVLKKIDHNLRNDTNKTHEVNLILIQNTSIAEIGEWFNETTFKKIFIENNDKLTKISPKAFKSGILRSLVIRDNKHLSDTNIFKLARNLEPSETIEFDYNNLNEVPEGGFQGSFGSRSRSLKFIYLNNNNITKIGNFPFDILPKLEILSLNDNKISDIAKKGLQFEVGVNLTVLLNNNYLTTESFKGLKEINPNITQLRLHLENNKIDDLPKDIFKEILETEKIELFLNDNNFKCKNCTLLWLLDLKGKASDNFHSVYCNKGNNIKVPVTHLEREDICQTLSNNSFYKI